MQKMARTTRKNNAAKGPLASHYMYKFAYSTLNFYLKRKLYVEPGTTEGIVFPMFTRYKFLHLSLHTDVNKHTHIQRTAIDICMQLSPFKLELITQCSPTAEVIQSVYMWEESRHGKETKDTWLFQSAKRSLWSTRIFSGLGQLC